MAWRDVLAWYGTYAAIDAPAAPAVRFAYANQLGVQGRGEKALTEYETMLRLRRKSLPERHPDTLTAAARVAEAYFYEGRYADAAELAEPVVRVWRQSRGPPRHPESGACAGVVVGRPGARGGGRAARGPGAGARVRRRMEALTGRP
ncbi:hypothetical protein GCM10017788_01900 [Amycolatopsis acidiphila]|uniref:Tetratricopeptide repeat protein n=1 Tax=Amycolatopsis acidiphila TaxID=715473 RepID=A0A558AFE7_9PSEU|nr:tetratricopeptide repeat protein [Amycolatopsis acidiphila]GHG53288.1 hypothetical protein GCM10017788_01900 [Amycolatopsis acidiphila]